jgi:PHP family Zn ribbon phosphoesterase
MIPVSIRAMANTAMEKSSNRYRCQHEYPENEWKCAKCGHEILPDLIEKIAVTSMGTIMATIV